MTEDVLDIDDRVVHQQAKREDQGKQSDPVDGVAKDQVAQQGYAQCHGYRQGDDEGFLRAEGEHQQNDDGYDGDHQMLHQFVDLVVSRFAVVAGDGQGHILGNEFTTEFFCSLDDLLGDGHGIGPLALGDADGDSLAQFSRFWRCQRGIFLGFRLGRVNGATLGG